MEPCYMALSAGPCMGQVWDSSQMMNQVVLMTAAPAGLGRALPMAYSWTSQTGCWIQHWVEVQGWEGGSYVVSPPGFSTHSGQSMTVAFSAYSNQSQTCTAYSIHPGLVRLGTVCRSCPGVVGTGITGSRSGMWGERGQFTTGPDEVDASDLK